MFYISQNNNGDRGSALTKFTPMDKQTVCMEKYHEFIYSLTE